MLSIPRHLRRLAARLGLAGAERGGGRSAAGATTSPDRPTLLISALGLLPPAPLGRGGRRGAARGARTSVVRRHGVREAPSAAGHVRPRLSGRRRRRRRRRRSGSPMFLTRKCQVGGVSRVGDRQGPPRSLSSRLSSECRCFHRRSF